ncbi:SCAPER isoform 16, partial [Pongo abelii]
FRAKEYESLMETKNSGSDSPYKAKLQRLAKDLLKQLQVQDSGSWANNKVSALDRTLGEITRILEKEVYTLWKAMHISTRQDIHKCSMAALFIITTYGK